MINYTIESAPVLSWYIVDFVDIGSLIITFIIYLRYLFLISNYAFKVVCFSFNELIWIVRSYSFSRSCSFYSVNSIIILVSLKPWLFVIWEGSFEVEPSITDTFSPNLAINFEIILISYSWVWGLILKIVFIFRYRFLPFIAIPRTSYQISSMELVE